MAVFPRTNAWRQPGREPCDRLGTKNMAQILRLQETYGARDGLHEPKLRIQDRQDEGESYSFWPEVSCGAWSVNPAQADPRNSPRRVLSEMMLIVGGAGLLVLLTTIFLGTPSS